MNAEDRIALEAKRAEIEYRRSLSRESSIKDAISRQGSNHNPRSYDDTPVGTFHSADKIFLRWVEPDLFEYMPRQPENFSFERSSGDVITPTRMFTDGGSIPRAGWVLADFSPWNYVPAFIVHDWEFDAHHCEVSEKTFDEVSATMMEGVKTLMETGVCEKSIFAFNAIQAGISSFIGRRSWERRVDVCPLP
ncbi:DUF1353 domain-containing protein [Tranquillimonas rosea]|uniref:DUF1353 domain-containing protein n=1 Tax=Tranquillimonas rosea TaxID=641238 RepID=UPI000B8217D0|nr:DUF1353 domain-containing protein [Tranquillimonas rosea]